MIHFDIIFCLVLIISLTECNHFNKRAENLTSHFINHQNKFPTNKTTNNENKLQMKVYYETLCPASVEFFKSQLKPVMEKLGAFLQVNLIPYGHARTSRVQGRYTFTCQHGAQECFGNKLHACVIDSLQNSTEAVLVNACLIQYYTNQSEYISLLNWCTYVNKIKTYGVRSCVNGQRGRQLLKMYGDRTHEVQPHYVPFIVLEGSIDKQELVEINLMKAVCSMLPSPPTECYSFIQRH